MKRKFLLFCIVTLLLSSTTSFSQNHTKYDYTKYDGLALTPPMGWNSWNKFGCDVNEEMIRQMADAMVSSGMKDAGYTYINIDDCWHGYRDSSGFIHENTERFPSGMKSLADYIHSKGLKLGIYSDAGSHTCAGKPGSRGYEFQDAMQYAEWGVDYLKYDWCNAESLKAEGAYKTMAAALKKAGRPIVFSICEWGSNNPSVWAAPIGHLWRTTGDIHALFDGITDHGGWSTLGVLQILDLQDTLRKYAGPDHWNDPDMLEVGNQGLNFEENKSHFSLWAMLAAPLIAGNDLRNMPETVKNILTNKEVIAINQDKLGVQALVYSKNSNLEILFKPLDGDDWAVCFLNRSAEKLSINFNWKENTFIDNEVSKRVFDTNKIQYNIKDLWTKQPLGSTEKILISDIPGHGVIMMRLSH